MHTWSGGCPACPVLAIEQAGRTYGGGAEPPGRAVHRAVGVGPAALAFAEDAYLLATGRIVVVGKAADISKDESIRRSYLGY